MFLFDATAKHEEVIRFAGMDNKKDSLIFDIDSFNYNYKKV